MANDRRDLLISYHDRWLIYKPAINSINNLFAYLNGLLNQDVRRHLHSAEPELEVGDMCRYLWHSEIIEPLETLLVDSLLKQLELDKKGLEVNQGLISDVIHSFVEVGGYYRADKLRLYRTAVEEPFLVSTRRYYSDELKVYRTKLDSSNFLKRVSIYQIIQNVEIVGIVSIIDEILLRSSKFMHSSTMRPLIRIIVEETLKCTTFLHCSSRDKVISEIKTRESRIRAT